MAKHKPNRARSNAKSRSAGKSNQLENVLKTLLSGKAGDPSFLDQDDDDENQDDPTDPTQEDDSLEGMGADDLLDGLMGDDSDVELDETDDDAGVSIDPDQLDAMLDAVLGISDDDQEDEMSDQPMPEGMSAAAKAKAKAAKADKARKAAAQKQAHAKSVATQLMGELKEVNLPTSVKRVIVDLAVERKQRELDAKAARLLEQKKQERLAERKRAQEDRAYIDSLLEEKLMNTRMGRSFGFGGYANERGMKGFDRERMASIRANTKFRRGLEFKLADVIKAATNPEFRMGYMKEFKALGGATGAGGGYIVPEEWSADFIKLLRAKAVVRQLAKIVPMSSDTLHLPKQTGASNAQWVGENADTSSGATDQTFGELVFNAKKLVAFSKTSNELLDDSSYGAEKIIRDDLMDDVVLAEDYAFLFGATGGNNPVGIYSLLNASQKLAGSGTSNALTGDDIYRVMNRVEKKKARINVWYTNADGLQVIRTLKDNNGNYLFSQQNGVNGLQQVLDTPEGEDPEDYNAPVGQIAGRDVYLTEQIPSTVTIASNAPTTLTGGTATLLIGGDRKQLAIGQRKSIEIMASNVAGTAFANDQTWFRAILREDFKLRVDDTFAMVAFPIGS